MAKLSETKLPEKLSKYLEWIENETGRQIDFQTQDSVGLSGMSYAFRTHPSKIVICTTNDVDLSHTKHSDSIAHEATHGYVLYQLGYCSLSPKVKLTQTEQKTISLLRSLIDDIIVNRIIAKKGFCWDAGIYFGTIAEETRAARRGTDYYMAFSNDPTFKFRFIAQRYVVAWVYINYFDLDTNKRNRLQNFMDSFSRRYQKQVEMAKEIINVLSCNDVFSIEGHKEVLKRVVPIWGLESKVIISE